MVSLRVRYEQHVLPHLIDCACGMREVMHIRSALVPRAVGNVLEVGIGTGLNLSFYDETAVDSITGVDPSAAMGRRAQRRASAVRIPVDTIALELEEIAAPSGSFDTIVCTFTMCTIPDARAALREMRRVLRPGGRLLFAEHGLAPDETVARWQDRLTPWWRPLAGGCHLNRDIPALIRDGGFTIDEMAAGYVRGPRPLTYIYRGSAR